jgi:lipopolysaccharide/colanic/teichoic acid biosynthesis glycosyltransferase
LREQAATVQKGVELDLWYINNRSLWLDIKILMNPFSAMIGQKEAY